MGIETFKDHYRETRLFTGRILQLVVLILVLIAALVIRLIYLQVDQHHIFAQMSAENRARVQPLPPTRGLIYDRRGRILAQNNAVHSLVIVPERVVDMDYTLHELARILVISEDDLQRFHRLRKQRRRFENVPLRSVLNEHEVGAFAVNRHRFPGVDIEAKLLRYYPHGVETSHVVGYVGRVSTRDLQEIDVSAYSGTSHIGKTGVEKYYETELHGQVGLQRVEVNALGRTVKVLDEQPPRPGRDLYLSLDLELQRETLDAFGEENGAVVAIDPQDGAILAMVSKPGFDGNLFVEGISQRDYRALQTSDDKPLFNRALRGRYPPGSTTKPFFGLLGLESGEVRFRETTYCPGYYQLPNHEHRYRDWKKTGHGAMNMSDAIVQSCDVYFYDLSHQLGVQQMHDFMAEFGFGHRLRVDITGELGGLLPSPEWKRRTLNTAWYPGETLIFGIGQGYFLTTPLELASATATLAASGQRFRPHVVAALDGPPGDQQAVTLKLPDGQVPIVDPTNWSNILDAMAEVVEHPRGTARRIHTPAYRIAGKTGTAQVFTVGQEEEYDETTLAKKMRDHALFIGFAPLDKPRIALAVVVENGGHGGAVAAPIARRIMDRYLVRD